QLSSDIPPRPPPKPPKFPR
ncbi:unnamed protein product, partial [Rotaria magnacalcarata]